jgi:uncharacterized membrane protein
MPTMSRHFILSALVVSVAHPAVAAPPRYEAIVLDGPPTYSPAVELRGVAFTHGTLLGQVVGWNRSLSVGFIASPDGEPALLRPLPGYNGSGVSAINSSGLVVGVSSSVVWHESTRGRATAWIQGLPIDLGTLGGRVSGATDLNEAGVILGNSLGADGIHRACLWIDGQIEPLPMPEGATFSAGTAIADTGFAAGMVLDEHGDLRAARWAPDGGVQLLSLLGEHIFNQWAVDINDAGVTLVMVTEDEPVMNWSGVWRGEAIERIPGEDLWATAINNHGAAIGRDSADGPFYFDADGVFVLADQIDIGPTNLAYAEQIDDRGWIVGSVWTDGGQLLPVLLKPIESAGSLDE